MTLLVLLLGAEAGSCARGRSSRRPHVVQGRRLPSSTAGRNFGEGQVGEVLVVRKLSPGMLPSSRFGGARITESMIHATWYLTTIAFLTVGSALRLSGSVLLAIQPGESAWSPPRPPASRRSRWGWAAYTRSRRSLFLHPGPAMLTRHRGAGVVGSKLSLGPCHPMREVVRGRRPHACCQSTRPFGGAIKGGVVDTNGKVCGRTREDRWPEGRNRERQFE
jgi:hypothetical protein